MAGSVLETRIAKPAKRRFFFAIKSLKINLTNKFILITCITNNNIRDENMNIYIKQEYGDDLGHFKLKKQISNEDAQKLIDILKNTQCNGEDNCYANISAHIDSKEKKTPYGPVTEKRLILDTGKPSKMICITGNAPLHIISQRQCAEMCGQCLIAGKCENKDIIETIGKIVFPDIYKKTR